MARPTSKHPTEVELQILKALWAAGALSGQGVRDALAPVRDVAYTSVMTTLGIMEEKGYVKRSKKDGRFQYAARVTEKATSRRMLRDMVDRVFDGSTVTAMMNLLEASDVDADEMSQLRELIQRRSKEQS